MRKADRYIVLPRVLVQNLLAQAYMDGMNHERKHPIRNYSLTRTIGDTYGRNIAPKIDGYAARARRDLEQEQDETLAATERERHLLLPGS